MLKQSIQKVVNAFGYQFHKLSETPKRPELVDYPCIDLLDLVMQNYIQNQPDIFFIQIGAHDGISADPASRLIRRYPDWHGILIEPLPALFKQLVENYKGYNHLIFEQLLVGQQDGTAKFYTVDESVPDLPFWVSQSSSMDREWVRGALYYWKHVKHISSIPDDFDSVIEEISVPSITSKTLLLKHDVKKLDLLMMATPGFDFEILQSFPFDQVKPPIICFEYWSLQEREACLRFLADLGYSVGRFASRAVASLNSPMLNWTISDY